jgi:hypothetical protein
MEMKVIKEQPLMTLVYRDYNTSSVTKDIYAKDLKEAQIGDKFMIEVLSSCGRDVHDEVLEVVYKNDEGCACLHRKFGTDDTAMGRPWEFEPKLIWFELN